MASHDAQRILVFPGRVQGHVLRAVAERNDLILGKYHRTRRDQRRWWSKAPSSPQRDSEASEAGNPHAWKYPQLSGLGVFSVKHKYCSPVFYTRVVQQHGSGCLCKETPKQTSRSFSLLPPRLDGLRLSLEEVLTHPVLVESHGDAVCL